MIVTIPVGCVDEVSVNVRWDAGDGRAAEVLLHVPKDTSLDALRARAVAALLATAAEFVDRKGST